MTPAECNLEFIRMYLKYRPPTAPIRTFIDDWFAYHKGGSFLTRTGRPRWFNKPCPIKYSEALLSVHFVSKDAFTVIKNGGGKDLVKDHSIPVKVLRTMLEEMDRPTLEEIEKFLLRYYKLGVLTVSENKDIRRLGRNSKMPDGWDRKNVFARYDEAKICAQVRLQD